MDITLPLNNRTQDGIQAIRIPIELPDYLTHNGSHGLIHIEARLLDNSNVLLNFAVRREDGKLLYAQRWAYTPAELIPNAKSHRRQE